MKKQGIIVFAFIVLFLSLPSFVYAKKQITDALPTLGAVAGKSGVEQTDVGTVAGQIIKGALSLVGIIFFILMVYAGITWMTDRGNDERVTKARGTIVAATIGLFIVIASYAITNFVTTRIIEGGRPVGVTDTVGCCIDWVSTLEPSDLNFSNAIPVSRITTQVDCQIQGEEVSDNDRVGGPEGRGFWVFESDIVDADACRTFMETEF